MEQKNPKIFRKQPILCPWITSQPYHSSINKNRAISQGESNCFLNILNEPSSASSPINHQSPSSSSSSHHHHYHHQDFNPNNNKPPPTLPSIQQSCSQFFYFLRLMQLFPDTHPATLHTVLALCKNDFFRAVDKLLYAKRCKLLYYKKNMVQQKNNKGLNNGKNKNVPNQNSTSKLKAQQQNDNNNGDVKDEGNYSIRIPMMVSSFYNSHGAEDLSATTTENSNLF